MLAWDAAVPFEQLDDQMYAIDNNQCLNAIQVMGWFPRLCTCSTQANFGRIRLHQSHKASKYRFLYPYAYESVPPTKENQEVACGIWASCLSQILSLRDWKNVTVYVGLPPNLPWPGPTPIRTKSQPRSEKACGFFCIKFFFWQLNGCSATTPLYEYKSPDFIVFKYWEPDMHPPVILEADMESARNTLGK